MKTLLYILIYEDDLGHREHIESVVRKQIVTDDVEMELILICGDPADVRNDIKAHPDTSGLYFLDIDLQYHEMNGMKLATMIRETDPYAKIVFIIAHSELAYLTDEHKLEAIDYIVKERSKDIETRVIESILTAYKCYLEEKPKRMYFKVAANGEVWMIPYDDILFFETNSETRNKIILHTAHNKLDFRGTLGEVETRIPEFYRCHKSYLLNPKKIACLDRTTKEAVMVNDGRAHVSEKKMSELAKVIGKR
ncbi:MAG: LytTR family DNA-binding domain-containing protein [Clostridiales bacterium]|nr:LytTR family DNA-binding domain-containing protein [Clostridiales bacterium]